MEKLFTIDAEFNFTCRRCASCCKAGGHIMIHEGDMQRLSAFLKRPLSIKRDYDVLPKKADGRTCFFFDDQTGCTVYSARPDSCRIFPLRQALVGLRQKTTIAFSINDSVDCPGIQGRTTWTPRRWFIENGLVFAKAGETT